MRTWAVTALVGVLLAQGVVASGASSEAAAPGRTTGPTTGQAPGTFVDITPVTILDTAAGVGAAGSIRMHSVTAVHAAGVGEIPAAGSPVLSMVVTISGAHAFGAVTIYPAGEARPSAATAAVDAGQPRASSALVPIGTGGDVELANPLSTPMRVTIQVVGYYLDGVATGGGTYTPLPATRVYDTARDPGLPDGLKFVPASDPNLRVQLAGVAGVPRTGVSSVELEVTTRAATQDESIYLDSNGVDFRYDGNFALVSFSPRSVSTTLVAVDLASDGSIEMSEFGEGSVQVGVDVVGYFHSGTPTLPGAFVMLTRNAPQFGRVSPDSAVTVHLAGYDGLPSKPVADMVLLFDAWQNNVDPDDGQAGLAVYPDGGARPANAQLDFRNHSRVAAAVTTPLGKDGSVVLRNSSTLRHSVDLHFLTLGYHLAG